MRGETSSKGSLGTTPSSEVLGPTCCLEVSQPITCSAGSATTASTAGLAPTTQTVEVESIRVPASNGPRVASHWSPRPNDRHIGMSVGPGGGAPTGQGGCGLDYLDQVTVGILGPRNDESTKPRSWVLDRRGPHLLKTCVCHCGVFGPQDHCSPLAMDDGVESVVVARGAFACQTNAVTVELEVDVNRGPLLRSSEDLLETEGFVEAHRTGQVPAEQNDLWGLEHAHLGEYPGPGTIHDDPTAISVTDASADCMAFQGNGRSQRLSNSRGTSTSARQRCPGSRRRQAHASRSGRSCWR